jgi:hypothetical protein
MPLYSMVVSGHLFLNKQPRFSVIIKYLGYGEGCVCHANEYIQFAISQGHSNLVRNHPIRHEILRGYTFTVSRLKRAHGRVPEGLGQSF